MLHRLAYVSSSSTPLALDMLSDILEVSRQNNKRDGISGVLMYHDRTFFQILEGERLVVEDCYGRIARDFRHTDLEIVIDEAIDERSFAKWAMRYAGPDEIQGHIKHSLRSLADLTYDKGVSVDAGKRALELSHKVFDGL